MANQTPKGEPNACETLLDARTCGTIRQA